MSARFDPYHRWLGIPPSQQPADYYQLLGVQRFEADLEVIASGATRQIAHLRTFHTGPFAAIAQSLSNDVAEARTCLLSIERKAVYDAALRHATPRQRWSGAAPPAPRAVSEETHVPREPASYRDASIGTAAPAISVSSPPRKRRQRSSYSNIIGHIVAPIVGLAMGYLVLVSVGPEYDFLGLFDHEAIVEKASVTLPEIRLDPEPKRPTQPTIVEPTKKDAEQPDERKEPGIEPPPEAIPFGGLPHEVEVHQVDVAQLGEIPFEIAEELELKILAVDGEHTLARRFVSGGKEIAGQGARWPLYFVVERDIDQLGSTPTQPAAEIVRDGKALLFRWLSGPADVVRGNIANCVVQLNAANQPHYVRLRRPLEQDAMMIRLSREPIETTLSVENLPPTAALYLEPTFEGLPPMELVEGTQARVAIGDRVSWRFASEQFAGVMVGAVARQNTITIRLSVAYRLESEGATVFPLASDELYDDEQLGRRNLESRKANLRQREAGRATLESRLNAARNLPERDVTGFVNSGMQALKFTEIRKAESTIQRNEAAIAFLRSVIPAMERDLQRFPAFHSLANQIHDKARANFRLYTTAGGQVVDLARIGLGATIRD